MRQIILASASPRRRELLHKMGVEFTVIPAVGEERITKTEPGEVVQELALQKAAQVAEGWQEALVIGSDTVVVREGRILGKPKDEEEAKEMLRAISGGTHQVYTGVAVIEKDREKESIHVFYEAADVHVYPLSEEEISAYVATGEPMDKAGAYGIQGKFGVFVKGISGDYNTIVGFPVARFYQEMKILGIDLYGK